MTHVCIFLLSVLDSVKEIFKGFIKPFFSNFFSTRIFPSEVQLEPHLYNWKTIARIS